jgi:AcrR family transcriptional regulator
MGMTAESLPVLDRVASAIVDAAAAELRERGELTNMASVAARAGVSRATIYNHFANRDELFEAILLTAIGAVEAHIREAELDSVPVPEAVARLSRALVTCGTRYAVTTTKPHDAAHEETMQRIGEPVDQLLSRGLADGTFDAELSVEHLRGTYWGLISGALRLTGSGEAGIETAAAVTTKVFLYGVAQRAPAPDAR